MPQLAPREWSRQANQLQIKAGRPLNRADLIKELGTPNGKVTRAQSIEKGGRWKPRTGNRSRQTEVRARGERTYTTDSARESAKQIRKQARIQSQSTLHQHAHGNKPSIAEHGQNIASGGIGDDQDSVSDPYFKEFKDNIESKVRSKYGDKYIVDINEVTGFVRIIPREFYNKEQYRSNQPGFDVEPDMDVESVVNGLPFIVAENLGLSNTQFPRKPVDSQNLTSTSPQTSYTPIPLGGIDFSRIPQQTKTPPMTKIPPVTVMESNGEVNGNGNGNGNGYSGYNGNGNGNGNGHVDLNKLNETLVKAGVIAAQTIGSGLMLSPLAR